MEMHKFGRFSVVTYKRYKLDTEKIRNDFLLQLYEKYIYSPYWKERNGTKVPMHKTKVDKYVINKLENYFTKPVKVTLNMKGMTFDVDRTKLLKIETEKYFEKYQNIINSE